MRWRLENRCTALPYRGSESLPLRYRPQCLADLQGRCVNLGIGLAGHPLPLDPASDRRNRSNVAASCPRGCHATTPKPAVVVARYQRRWESGLGGCIRPALTRLAERGAGSARVLRVKPDLDQRSRLTPPPSHPWSQPGPPGYLRPSNCARPRAISRFFDSASCALTASIHAHDPLVRRGLRRRTGHR
jgi:hypothetical protein